MNSNDMRAIEAMTDYQLQDYLNALNGDLAVLNIRAFNAKSYGLTKAEIEKSDMDQQAVREKIAAVKTVMKKRIRF